MPHPRQSDSFASDRQRTRGTIWVLLITLGAASLRVFHIGSKSFSPDEAFSIFLARTGWKTFRHLLLTSEANMALYYLLLRLWSQISDAPSFVRALSVVPGVASIPAIYFLGKTLFSRRAGIVSALLLAANVFHIFYSQEARSYSLLVLLVTCSSLFFARYINNRRGADGFWYIFSSAASLYAHFFAVLVLLAQFAAWALLPRQIRSWSQVRNLIASGAFGLPLAVFMAYQGTSHMDWVHHSPHMAKEVYHFFISLSGSGLKSLMFLLAAALASRQWCLQRRCDKEGLQGWPFLFVSLWLLIPILVVLLISHWKPMFVFRFLIICLPAALLLFGYGLILIRPNWLCFAAVVVTVCASLIATKSFYRQSGPSDWKAAIRYLAQNVQAGDMLIFPNPYCRFPFDYNLRMSGNHLPSIQVKYADAAVIRDFPAEAHHIWIIDFSREAHRHCETLPCADGEPHGTARFRFEHAVRFPGVEIEEFELSKQVLGKPINSYSPRIHS
jgi:mannosyltransferase